MKMTSNTVRNLGVVLILVNFWVYQRWLFQPLWKSSTPAPPAPNTTGTVTTIGPNGNVINPGLLLAHPGSVK